MLLRSVATGMIGPLLGFYLAGLSYDEKTFGFVVSAGLAGAAGATAWVTLFGSMVERRTALLAVAGLSIAGGSVAALASGPWVVGAAAFVGMLNGMGRDRGACLVLEQAMLPETAGPAARTRAFAWYSVMQDAGTAFGGLASALPSVLRTTAGMEPLPALRLSMGTYLVLPDGRRGHSACDRRPRCRLRGLARRPAVDGGGDEDHLRRPALRCVPRSSCA